jgi:hypothetical protein
MVRKKTNRYWERRIMVFFSVTLAVFFLVVTLILSACDWQVFIPSIRNPEALSGIDPDNIQKRRTWSASELSSTLPDNSRLIIFEAVNLDGNNELRAIYEYSVPKIRIPKQQYLGLVTYQFGDAPFRTIMLEFGNNRLLIGFVDRSLEEQPIIVTFSRFEQDEFLGSEGKGSVVDKTEWAFSIPIFKDERESWRYIESIDIITKESKTRSDEAEDQGEFDEASRLLHYWLKTYSPPVDIGSLFVEISIP